METATAPLSNHIQKLKDTLQPQHSIESLGQSPKHDSLENSYDNYKKETRLQFNQKIIELIFEFISTRPELANLSKDYRISLINEIANSAEHIFFNSYDKLLKKQEHDIQVAAQKRAAEAEELRIKSWKEITIEVFEKKTIEKLDKIVEENPDTEFDKFIFDEYSKDVFKKLLYYFHGQAEKVGLIQNKPIALLGNIGVGKNTMMEAFCDNPYRSFIFHTSRDFTKAYSGNWGDNILEYFSEKSDINNYGHQYYDICVDELGREPKKSFKQKGEAYNTEGTNVMAVYLENAYKFKRIAHMISNEQDFDTFANYYGPHVADRLFSYYNIVEYRTDAPSRRTPPYTN